MSSKSQFTLQYYFKLVSPTLQYIRFLWTNKPYSNAANKFSVSPRSLMLFLAILKNTLKLEQWSNRILAFTQWSNRKQRGPQRISGDICISNKRKFSKKFSPKPRGKWQWRHLIRGAIWRLKNLERYLFTTRTVHFCPNIWILSRDPVLLSNHIQWFSWNKRKLVLQRM